MAGTDSLRRSNAQTKRSLKAATYRQAAATANLTAINKSLKAVVADLKTTTSGTPAEAHLKAKEALIRLSRKDAQRALADANEELETRTAEATKAKDAFLSHHAARPRRQNIFGEVGAPAQSQEVADGELDINELTIAAFKGSSKSLVNPSELTSFPEPPAAPCAKLACIQAKNSRKLAACEHNLADIFSSYSSKELKAARNTFHPDRFAKVDEDLRAEFQGKAKEIYSVVDSVFQKEAQKGKVTGKKAYQNNRAGGRGHKL